MDVPFGSLAGTMLRGKCGIEASGPRNRGAIIFQSGRSTPETEVDQLFTCGPKEDLVMWVFFEELYRDYCLARVQEMRKLPH